MPKMSDSTLTSICEAKLNNALGWMGGLLSKERTLALSYYRGDKFGNEQDGRSQVISRDVAEAIDGALPSLLKVFAAVDTVVACKPKRPDAEDSAKQATDYLNYTFQSQPNGFDLLQTWLKDGLLSKLGVVKSWWDDSEDVTTEEYEGLTKFQYLTLLSDEEVEPVSYTVHAEGPQEIDPGAVEEAAEAPPLPEAPPPTAGPGQLPQTPANMMAPPPSPEAPSQGADAAASTPAAAPPVVNPLPAGKNAPPPEMEDGKLYDCKIKRTNKKGRLCIEAVPPEEFLTDRRAVSSSEITFAAHRSIRTVSDLIEMGVPKEFAMSLPGGTELDYNAEVINRFKAEDEMPSRADTDALDPAMRPVWVAECYLQVDYNGDGIAEWRKVTIAGSGGWTILKDKGGEQFNDECDGHPFSMWTPFKQPHKLYGESMADKTMDIQLIKSTVWRGVMDNIYFNIAPQLGVVEGQANMEDVLTRRPGGIFRMKTPTAVFPIPTVDTSQSGMVMLGYLDSVRQNRTGMKRWSAGLEGNELNPLATTATGVQSVDDATDDTLELIARNFAEQGLKSLFKRMLELICKHQDKQETVRLRGQWVDIDPSTWDHEMDMDVMVGLGTGDKTKQVAQLMAMLTQVDTQIAAAQGGMSGPILTQDNVYKKVIRLSEAMGFKSSDGFYTDPATAPPQQPKPDPKQMEAEGKLALQKQKQDADLQHTQQKAALQTQLEQQKAETNAQREKDQAQADMATDRMHAQNQAQLEQMRLQAETMREQIRMEHEVARDHAKAQHDAHLSSFKAAMDAHVKMIAAKAKPKKKAVA